jgi:DNA-binding CsgD family transcriptional regulator
VPARPGLSEREAQIVAAVALGRSNKAVAYELGLSASSVATHLRRAQHKLGIGSRVELILAAAALAPASASASASVKA